MSLKPFRQPWIGRLVYAAFAVLLLVVLLTGRALYHMRLPDTTLTKEQEALPYAKYFDREMVAPSAELQAAVAAPIDCKDALPINDINKLLEPGYQKVETGYCVFADGGGYASALVKMPGVSLDMFNWWFIWHPQESLRYKIWDKDEHFGVWVNDADRRRFNDAALPLANRLWGSTHRVRENIGIPTPFRFLMGMGGKDPYAITIRFISPADCGFDMTKFNPLKETVVCADSGMRHFVRQTPDGVELRARFYEGYVRKNGAFVREGGTAPLSIDAGLNRHMLKEFTNLASFLPALYAEQGPKN